MVGVPATHAPERPGAVDASRTTRTTFVWERLMPAERIRIEHPVPALDGVRRRCAATPAENLSAIAILRELPHDTLVSLARRCTWRRFNAGQTILHYRDD